MATVKKEKNNALETVAQQRKIQAAQDQKDSKQKTQKKPRKAVAPDADNQRRNLRIPVGSRTIGYLKTSVRCCMVERYCKQFWQHGNPVPRSCHADQPS